DAAKNINNKYDFIFSRMVGEHIENGLAFHKNIFHLLNYNGKSFHCFSTLFSLPFIVNRILPDSLSNILLKKVASRDSYQHGKFKAYYSWCRGPSKNMIKRLEGIGFEIVEYVGYFGHNYYNKIALLRFLENIKSRLLLNKPVPNLTSYAHLILRKLPK
ncbi:MAG: hypothetical protein OQK57_03225, partial [Ignavibacteriaceae bacterium]|nr:hypothetical protein [Ignavibacteriaceae bacterium]